jgi:hypothetical protein
MRLTRWNFLKLTFGSALGLGLFAKTSIASAGGCCKCGCPQAEKVCRLVCEEKKVQVTLWGMNEEDFCVPGPSRKGCENCEEVVDPKENEKTPCYGPKTLVWSDWTPKGCPTLYTKKKLMKKVVTKTVPSYKWVVEDLCAECEKAVEKAVEKAKP